MTGVGGRPELVLEGAAHLEGPWTEIPFKYKPGAVDRPVPFIGKIYSTIHKIYKENYPLIALCLFSTSSTPVGLANVCNLLILLKKLLVNTLINVGGLRRLVPIIKIRGSFLWLIDC